MTNPNLATPMSLARATAFSQQIVSWLRPHCERIAVAGSIRRGRQVCHDVDIVCIPRITEHTDLLGNTISRDNHVLQFLQDYVDNRNPTGSLARTPRFISGGEKEGKQVIMELPKCQLDLWFATPETWAARLLCRTGSREHNIWLAERAAARGLHWNPYEGLCAERDRNLGPAGIIPSYTEEDIYAHLGLTYIAPNNREAAWLSKHIDSGL